LFAARIGAIAVDFLLTRKSADMLDVVAGQLRQVARF
jgi:hypothetical protein